jgi:superfamily II DNA/RNA helicase
MSDNLTNTYSTILANLGISSFNPMQEQTIRSAAKAANVILLSPTGSGKTLAFLVSIFSRLDSEKKGIQALIVAPSRELAIQIEQVFRAMKTPFKVSCIYGGHSVKIEQNTLEEAPAVLIATPGRLADHITRGTLELNGVHTVVLDEFDKSLQMGYHRQLELIFARLSGEQRHLLTSATSLEELPAFLPFRQAETVNFLQEAPELKLTIKLVEAESSEKVEALLRLVATFGQESCLVFCNHKEAVERVSTAFRNYQFEHGVFHGDLEQIEREKSLIKFRAGAHTVLIATDLAARGLDIPAVRHVVHYQLPIHEDAFIHRNGRTARMHADGTVYLVKATDEQLPVYLAGQPELLQLPESFQLPAAAEFVCLYISAGKKEKISKGDIVGLLTQKGGLQSSDIGLISLLDHTSYVAVRRALAPKTLAALSGEKLKKQKVKIAIAS